MALCFMEKFDGNANSHDVDYVLVSLKQEKARERKNWPQRKKIQAECDVFELARFLLAGRWHTSSWFGKVQWNELAFYP